MAGTAGGNISEMSYFIRVLRRMNRYHSRYLFVVLLALVVAINGYDLLFWFV
jgi:hypothetical protein